MDIEQSESGFRSLERVADLFYALRVREAAGMMEDMARHIEMVLKRDQVQDTSFHEGVMEINQLLQLLLVCLGNRDYILTADLIKYELIPRLRVFKN
ncbi:hypothetical protein [Kyrpidia sp.]|uniref:hypothetical protein n=1 Tax=Kyrpidia sp. TaxID=2073077 RepID=UPI00258B70F9|nr:hypothetical protein [Kyrpidia sp.]MCL6577744.1 hypothetical protein [Kyrpidia sp.]